MIWLFVFVSLLLLLLWGLVGLGKALAVYIHPLAHGSDLGAFVLRVGGWVGLVGLFAFRHLHLMFTTRLDLTRFTASIYDIPGCGATWHLTMT
jgi:hypothetical protein